MRNISIGGESRRAGTDLPRSIGSRASRAFVGVRAISGDRVLDILYPLAAIALILLGWELWVRLGHVPRFIMVPFSSVVQACWENAGILLHHTWVTVKESLYRSEERRVGKECRL